MENTHRQLHGGPIVESAVIVTAQIGGGALVESLFAVLALGEVVAERRADAPFVQRLPPKIGHFLLGAPDEVAFAGLRRIAAKSLRCPEDLGVKQPPKVVIGRIPPLVGRGGEQQEVTRHPFEALEGCFRWRGTRQSLSQLVAPSFVDALL